MKHLLHFPLFGGPILLHIFSGLILTQVTEAAIDPENLFLYIDESCRDPPLPPALVGPVKKIITVAVAEMEFLIDAALQNGFSWDPNDVEGGRAGRTFNAFFGQLPGTPSVTDDANTKDIKDEYQKLVTAIQGPKKYGIYCDSTAFDWVTTWPADTPAHFGPANQPIDPLLHPGGGAWYTKVGRRVPNAVFLIAGFGSEKPGAADICVHQDSAGTDEFSEGLSQPLEPFVILCPQAFLGQIGQDLATWASNGPLKDGEDLYWFSSAGATLLHEFTHAVLGTNEHEEDTYRAARCIDLAQSDVKEARTNADTFMNFALASYLIDNEWVLKGFSSPLKAAVPPPAPPAPPAPPPPRRRGTSRIRALRHRLQGRAGKRHWRQHRPTTLSTVVSGQTTSSPCSSSSAQTSLAPQSSSTQTSISDVTSSIIPTTWAQSSFTEVSSSILPGFSSHASFIDVSSSTLLSSSALSSFTGVTSSLQGFSSKGSFTEATSSASQSSSSSSSIQSLFTDVTSSITLSSSPPTSFPDTTVSTAPSSSTLTSSPLPSLTETTSSIALSSLPLTSSPPNSFSYTTSPTPSSSSLLTSAPLSSFTDTTSLTTLSSSPLTSSPPSSFTDTTSLTALSPSPVISSPQSTFTDTTSNALSSSARTSSPPSSLITDTTSSTTLSSSPSTSSPPSSITDTIASTTLSSSPPSSFTDATSSTPQSSSTQTSLAPTPSTPESLSTLVTSSTAQSSSAQTSSAQTSSTPESFSTAVTSSTAQSTSIATDSSSQTSSDTTLISSFITTTTSSSDLSASLPSSTTFTPTSLSSNFTLSSPSSSIPTSTTQVISAPDSITTVPSSSTTSSIIESTSSSPTTDSLTSTNPASLVFSTPSSSAASTSFQATITPPASFTGIPLTWSGTWSELKTTSPVSFSWFDIPTGTSSRPAATSDVVLIGGLFFALQANRQWLTDPKLKSQFLENVQRTKDETVALFNSLKINVPTPECSNTKRKKSLNALSERESRAMLHERDIISDVVKFIGDGLKDAAKILSCAVNVVNNLVDFTKVEIPDLHVIEDLTDTLAFIGKALADNPKTNPTPKPSEPTSASASSTSASESSTSSSTSSSSSSSSCTASTEIPICTQTIILSTSFISGDTTSFIVATTTKTACSTSTIAGCTAVGTTSATTTTATQSQYSKLRSFIRDPYSPATRFADPSHSAWLSSIIATQKVSTIGSITASSSASDISTNTPSPSSASSSVVQSSSPPTTSTTVETSLPLTSSTVIESSALPTSSTTVLETLPPLSSTATESLSPPTSSSEMTPPPSPLTSTTVSPPPPSTTAPAPSPTLEARFYMYHDVGSTPSNGWYLYITPIAGLTASPPANPCTDKRTTFSDTSLPPIENPLGPVWPTGSFPLPSGEGADGCTFTGDGLGPGRLDCGGSSLNCSPDPGRSSVECSRAMTVYPVIFCNVPISS